MEENGCTLCREQVFRMNMLRHQKTKRKCINNNKEYVEQ